MATTAALKLPDSAANAPFSVVARSAAPTNPTTDDVYLDDGTNTASTNAGWRRYNGTTWEDISAASGGGGSSPPFDDDTAILQDSADNTKKLIIDVGTIATATTRTLTMPDSNVSLPANPIGGTLGATDNVIPRADGTSTAILQASGITIGDSDEIAGATIDADDNTISQGTGAIKTISSGVAAAGTDRNLIIAAESGTADDLIEVTGLTVGEGVLLRADSGDTITVKHNDAGATIKMYLSANADVTLDEQNPLRLTLIASNVLVEDLRAGSSSSSLSIAVLADEKSTGTAGGSSSATTWNNRNLQTEISDTDNIVSISSNQFTPIAGTYLIFVSAVGHRVGSHRVRLYNVTGAATVSEGLSVRSGNADTVGAIAALAHVFTANGDAYRIDHYTAAAQATDGLGSAVGDGSNERYMEITLLKLA